MRFYNIVHVMLHSIAHVLHYMLHTHDIVQNAVWYMHDTRDIRAFVYMR